MQKLTSLVSKFSAGILLAATCGSAFADVIAVNGAFTVSSPVTTQTGRVTRNVIPSNCAAPKAFPGTDDVLAHRYNSYNFQNNGPATCVTAILSTSDVMCSSNIYAVTYTPSFNPASVPTNYLADTNSSTGTPTVLFSLPMSFIVPANSPIVVDVLEAGGPGTCSYTLQVSGLASGPIPTLSQWALLLLAVLLGGSTLLVLRRRR